MFGFIRKPTQTIADPIFGQLTLNRSFGWEGTVPSPVSGETMSVFIYRKDSNPTTEDHTIYSRFTENFASLVPEAKQELLSLLLPYLEEPDWEGPFVKTADELWHKLQLENISIFPGKPLQISFAFRDDDIWPDAIFNLSINETKVEGISLDD